MSNGSKADVQKWKNKSKLNEYWLFWCNFAKHCIGDGVNLCFESAESSSKYRSRKSIRLVGSHIFLFTRMRKMPNSGRFAQFTGTLKMWDMNASDSQMQSQKYWSKNRIFQILNNKKSFVLMLVIKSRQNTMRSNEYYKI